MFGATARFVWVSGGKLWFSLQKLECGLTLPRSAIPSYSVVMGMAPNHQTEQPSSRVVERPYNPLPPQAKEQQQLNWKGFSESL